MSMKQGLYESIHQWTVIFLLWVTPAIAAGPTSITAQCTGPVTLPCTAPRVEQHNYRAVSWYKVVNQMKLMGIIRKVDSSVLLYKGFDRSVTIGESDSLTIAHVTEEDAGIYRCSLFASLGGSNQDGHVSLQVSVCSPTGPATSPAAVSRGVFSLMSPSAPQLVTLPAPCLCIPSTIGTSASLSFVAVLYIVKGLACYCCIQVLRRVRGPKQESTQPDVDVEREMMESLREQIQRISLEKQRNSRARAQINDPLYSLYSE
ncbi:uncharacterized protein [Heptranchias perlo]|uniref:uncharacterized protein isoform X2 n=1 Tax=Heptranchias perlo TaxID=212740 RepID=UPI00355979A3